MSKNLINALHGEAWSISALVCDLSDQLDDEGRPLAERRAEATVRAGVTMEMRECPYKDARHGKLMNVSALTQIAEHLEPVLADISAFRHAAGAEPDWSQILAGVMDKLAAPACHLITHRDAPTPIPARVAVGHKLAEGYLGVMRKLLERIALGESIPVSTEVFLEIVHQSGALFGASEVCAGSTAMLQHTTEALIDGQPETTQTVDPIRLLIARDLALQVQMGVLWELYDRVHLSQLMDTEIASQLKPCNDFLQAKLNEAQREHGQVQAARPLPAALPRELDSATREQLGIALQDQASPAELQPDIAIHLALLGQPGSVIAYRGDHQTMAHRVANYLHCYRLFLTALTQLEWRLRKSLDYHTQAPVKLGGLAFPLPQALPWFELILGCRMNEAGHLQGSQVGVRQTPLVNH